jgi:hypothetical protein
MSLEVSQRFSVNTVLSGSAAGVIPAFLQGEATASFRGDQGRFVPHGMREGADGARP